MKTCPYCGSNLEKITQHQYYCGFCEMNLDAASVKENSERLDVRVREFVADHYIEKNTPELMIFSTFELLYLLKSIRKERSDMYHHLHVFLRPANRKIQKSLKRLKKRQAVITCTYLKKCLLLKILSVSG